ncbi:O-antigen ligase family protein [Pelotomaculum isophthalicicum JI]|uniref:O-antigen ligase family protein n=1 Tax=Pelotomaculum isophthalicicum JI TaxID=947010 RepID=A0A9X4H585_9FIRM|nr:O-antigen ligase family protein [Pelotomaculum isophthalicicum]MDF9407913.1 O-antigen ligase family protein [Pelotomaculum isophthalicicum JI]
MSKVSAKGKKKAAAVKKTPESDQWEIIHAIAFWGLAILLFLPPYFRGLFFQPEQERALIFAAVIFWLAWLWKWSKRDYSFLSHPLDYCVLAFPAVYLVSAFQAANYGLAVDEAVKTTLYFLVYWLASRLVRDEQDIVTILHVIYISAVGVALAGLATATGIVNIKDGFLNGRVYSSFQYPNALASYLAAVTFIGFYLWRRAGAPSSIKGAPAWLNLGSFYQYLYAAGNLVLFAVLLGTKSNGGLLVFSAVFILFLIGLPKGTRIPVFIHFIFAGIPAFLAIWGFLAAVAGGKMGLAWLWMFVGLALALAGQALYSFAERKGLLQWIAAHRNVVLAVAALVIVAGCTGAGVYVSGHSDAVKTLAGEIRLRNATERMYFFQDAMKMFKERPIIGWGGGGWQEAYRAYQSYLYNSNQVHGHYFQIMVEAGILGLLAILGIWASFLFVAHRLYHGARENTAGRLLIWTITIAAVSIGLHAVIDFDLSLSALAMVLWTMFGFARGIGIYTGARTEEKKSRTYVAPNNAVLVGVSIISIMLIFYTGTLAVAGNYALQAGHYFQKQNINQEDINKGVSLLQKASSYSSLNAEYHSNLARVYAQQGKLDEGMVEAKEAVKVSKYNAQCYADLAGLYLNGNKNNEEAVNAAEKALSLAPFQIQWYELLARTYFVVGYNVFAGGNPEKAKQYFEKAVQVPARIQSQMDSLNDQEKMLWKDAPLLSPTPGVKLNVGIAQYILGMWTEAEANLQAGLQDERTKGDAALWLSLLKDKQGKAQEANDLLQQAKQSAPQLAQSYEGLRNLIVKN